LADGLIAAGLEVWIDRRVKPGDAYQQMILQYIRDCCAFLPLISRSTQPESDRWFRIEWAEACDKAKSFFGTDRNFIFPVVIDDTPYADLIEMRRNTFGRSAVRALGGAPPADLITQLDTTQKAYRKRNTRQ